MFLAIRDLRFAKGRFALMAAVIALITLLLVMLSGLTAGLGNQSTSAIAALGADQIVFGAQHRFVLEGPPPSVPLPAPRAQPQADADAPAMAPERRWTQRVPWLLVTAGLLAAALSALLVFGAR